MAGRPSIAIEPRSRGRPAVAISVGGIVSGFAKGDKHSHARVKNQKRPNRRAQTGARVSAQQIFWKKMRVAVRAAMSCSTPTRDPPYKSSARPCVAERYGACWYVRLAGADVRARAPEPGLMTETIHRKGLSYVRHIVTA